MRKIDEKKAGANFKLTPARFSNRKGHKQFANYF